MKKWFVYSQVIFFIIFLALSSGVACAKNTGPLPNQASSGEGQKKGHEGKVYAPLGESATNMRKGPYLMLTGDKEEMQVIWQTQKGFDKSVVYWGEDTNYNNHSADLDRGDDYTYNYTITGLINPGTRYYYYVKIMSTHEEWEYHGEFMSPPGDIEDEVTFYAFGDTRDNPTVVNNIFHVMYHDATEGSLRNTRQTFVIHTGDFVHRGLEEVYWDGQFFYNREHTSTNRFLAFFPMMAAVGNHEFYSKDIPLYSGTAGLFRKYWPNLLLPDVVSPNLQNYYYSFDYGPVHFAVIDPYTSRYDIGSDQYEWLEKDLSDTKKTWKIVVTHQPFYDAGGSPNDVPASFADAVVMQETLIPLLEGYGVQLVIQGHQHYYSRTFLDNITYLVLGGGGGPLVTPKHKDDLPPHDVPYEAAHKYYYFVRFEVKLADDAHGFPHILVTPIRVIDSESFKSFDHIGIYVDGSTFSP